LRRKKETNEWALQSGFDGDELLSRPDIQVITVEKPMVCRAVKWLAGCEACMPGEAQVPFAWVLDRVTGCDGKTTDYVMVRPARCPKCVGDVLESTIIQLKDGDDAGDADFPISRTCRMEA
jgi:hypothetical protein